MFSGLVPIDCDLVSGTVDTDVDTDRRTTDSAWGDGWGFILTLHSAHLYVEEFNRVSPPESHARADVPG